MFLISEHSSLFQGLNWINFEENLKLITNTWTKLNTSKTWTVVILEYLENCDHKIISIWQKTEYQNNSIVLLSYFGEAKTNFGQKSITVATQVKHSHTILYWKYYQTSEFQYLLENWIFSLVSGTSKLLCIFARSRLLFQKLVTRKCQYFKTWHPTRNPMRIVINKKKKKKKMKALNCWLKS